MEESACTWIKSWLKDRVQRVMVSDPTRLSVGAIDIGEGISSYISTFSDDTKVLEL